MTLVPRTHHPLAYAHGLVSVPAFGFAAHTTSYRLHPRTALVPLRHVSVLCSRIRRAQAARVSIVACTHATPPPADPNLDTLANLKQPAVFGPRAPSSPTTPITKSAQSAPNEANTTRRRPRAIDAAKLAVLENIQGRRGVVATAAIAPGEVAARVPVESTLSVCFADALADSASDEYPFAGGDWVSHAYWRNADWENKLACLLLYHRALGNDSPWQTYVESLPTPEELWTATDLDSHQASDLQYVPMMDAVEVYRFRLRAEYDRLRSALPPLTRDQVSFEDYSWVMKIVQSRAFSIPPGGFAASVTRIGMRGAIARRKHLGHEWPRRFAMVPFLDMMNHGSGDTLAKFVYDEEEDVFQLIAGENGYQPGSQVLVSYGDLTNDDLMLLYGFVQAGNPSDVYEIEDITDWAIDHKHNSELNLFQRKIKLLEETGMVYEGRKFLVSRSSVDEHLLATLRVLLASPAELAELAATDDGKRMRQPADKWYQPISTENELAVWTAVEKHADRMLAEFPTSLDEDEEMIILLAARDEQSHVAISAPLLFRVEKKRILRDVTQLAALKRLCIATDAGKDSEQALIRLITDNLPPPPESW